MPKECNNFQERNPFTKRCNKKCESGKMRNQNYKCVFPPKTCKSTHLYDEDLNKCVTICSELQTRNPKTGRCLNPCKIGSQRDISTMRCKSVTSKTRKRSGTIEHKSRKISSKLKGCISYGRTPKKCLNTRDYMRQSKIFHPMNNLSCYEDSVKKMDKLYNLCSEKIPKLY